MELLRGVLSDAPSHAEANFLLGQALMQIGEPARAVWPLRRSAESSEYAVKAGIMLTKATLQGRNTHDALAAVGQVLELEPENTVALELLMKIHLKNIDYEPALVIIDRILEIDPDNLTVLVPRIQTLLGLKRIDEVEESLAAARLQLEEQGDDAAPEVKATLCAAHAVFTFEKGETEEADVLITACLEEYPINMLVVMENVKFNDNIGRRKKATEILRKVYEDTGGSAYRKALTQRMRSMNRIEEELELLLEETVENPSPSAWFQLGDHYTRHDNYSAGVTAFEQAIAGNDNPDPMIRFALADTLIQNGDYEKAKAQAALFQNEHAVFKHLLIGRVHLEQGDPENALKSFETGVTLWPNNGVARYLAGQAAEQLGDFNRAIAEYREALRRNPEQSDAGLALAELYEALGIYQDALDAIGRHARSHVKDPLSYETTVRIAHRLGRHKLVSEALTRFGQIPGREASAAAMEARLVNSGKGPALAVQVIERSELDLTDPANAEALRALLEQYEDLGNSAAAQKSVAKALEAHPDEATFHELNARLMRATDQPIAEVRAVYERAIELDAENVNALIGLAEITAEAGQVEEAVALYDRAAEADSDDVVAPYAAAKLLIESNSDEAIRRLEEILVDHPHDGRVANDLALLLVERKDFDRAMKLAKRANQFVAAEEAVETIGWIHLLRGEHAPAIETLTRAVERRPKAAVARYRLGLAYLGNGDEESARKTFREVIDGGTKPESDRALAELARLDAGG